MKIESSFAIIDVKKGRKKLSKHFEHRPRFGECPPSLRIPVTITGYLEGQHSRDDGESIGFSMSVDSIKTA